MVRRTPALTNRCREMFEAIVTHHGFVLNSTVPYIAQQTGLSPEQVRDALFSPSSDEWRRRFASSLRTGRIEATPSQGEQE